MDRLLVLIPTTTYRTHDFIEAGRRLNVEVVVGSDQRQALSDLVPGSTIALNFLDLSEATRAIVEFARKRSLNAIIAVDDDAALLAAMSSEAISLPHNSVQSVYATRNKHQMRKILSEAGIPSPRFEVFSVEDNPAKQAGRVSFPCVVKPLFLSASRGVIRGDDPDQFVTAFQRLVKILRSPDLATRGGTLARQILVETYIPGEEVAVEGILVKGELKVLALFDKPDPLEGPFFEETIYITPSRLPSAVQKEITSSTARATKALGLEHGPVHAELRVNDKGAWVIEIAARSIGGLCSRILRFGTGVSLEEVILRHTLGSDMVPLVREKQPVGVMMIPIPGSGTLREVRGLAAAEAVPGIEGVSITISPGQEVVPLPEGNRYLGFIFARGESPERVEAALREAHRQLEFVITPKD